MIREPLSIPDTELCVALCEIDTRLATNPLVIPDFDGLFPKLAQFDDPEGENNSILPEPSPIACLREVLFWAANVQTHGHDPVFIHMTNRGKMNSSMSQVSRLIGRLGEHPNDTIPEGIRFYSFIEALRGPMKKKGRKVRHRRKQE
jgi:hypothetical protein